MSDDGELPSQRDPSLGELMTQLSEQTSRLVRDELHLAKIELKDTARHAGLGVGLFGLSGLLAFFGVAALIVTAILALALVVPAWAAALIVAGLLLLTAGVAALIGKSHAQQSNPTPKRTVKNVKRDVNEVQEAREHDDAHRS